MTHLKNGRSKLRFQAMLKIVINTKESISTSSFLPTSQGDNSLQPQWQARGNVISIHKPCFGESQYFRERKIRCKN